MNELQTISNVKCYIDEKGIVQLNLEDVAKGLGFTQSKRNAEYVRWERVWEYLKSFGFSPEVGKEEPYIPEPMFYLLAMKADSTSAQEFQKKVAYDILPAIRKHGMYATDELLDNPDLLIQVATALKEERKKNKELTHEVKVKDQIIGELKPKADYVDKILKNPGLVTITQIAKDYGMTGQAMNELLHSKGIQYKQSGQWLLYKEYQNLGYTHSQTVEFERTGGIPGTKLNTKWTQKGRLFLYEILKKDGIVPVIEKLVA